MPNIAKRRSFISVIIATYNRSESLKETLESLVKQDCDGSYEYEVIVADNNSNDKTKETVESYKSRSNGKLKYLFEPRQGKPYALNKGIAQAKGEVIAFTDDDCIIDKYWLLNIAKSFNGDNSGINMVGGKSLPLWPNESRPNWFGDYFLGPLGILDYGDKPIIFESDSQRLFFGNNFAFKKKLFDTYGGFDTRMINAHDTEICSRFLRAGVKGLYNPDIKILHKIPTNRLSPKYFYGWFYRRGKLWDLFEDKRVKFYYPLGIPLWFIKAFIEDGIKFMLARKSYDRLKYGCRCARHLGKMAARIQKNII
ncbi:MAG: glycosyltransferase [Candidatus Omnitrophota bacterium]